MSTNAKRGGALLAASFIAIGAMTFVGGMSDDSRRSATPADCYPSRDGGESGVQTMPMLAADYTLTSPFGPRGGQPHNGLDMAAPLGTPIYAATNGTVAEAGGAAGFGNWIVLDSDDEDISTVYGHMASDGVHVSAGERITAGQHIADVGSEGQSSGPHLHFEVWEGGRLTGGDPVDPEPWLSDATEPNPDQEPDMRVVQVGMKGPNGAGCGPAPSGAELDVRALTDEYPDAAKFVPWIEQAGETCAEVTAPLIAAQLHNESGFSLEAYNAGSGAEGPAQFLPATWEAYGVDGDGDGTADPYSAADSAMSMANYDCALAELARQDMDAGKVDGDLTALMLSYYNCGPGASQESGGVCGNPETEAYVVDIPAQAKRWSVTGSAEDSGDFGAQVVAHSREWIGTDYAWGGGDQNGPTKGIRDGGPADAHGDYDKIGFDCSGLVTYAVAQASDGATVLPRYSGDQISSPLGTPITDPADLQPGDIIQPEPGHVMIFTGEGTVVEAPESGMQVRERDYEPPPEVQAIRFGPEGDPR